MSSAAGLEEMSKNSISLMLTNVTLGLRLCEFLLHTERGKCLVLASGAVTKVNRLNTDASLSLLTFSPRRDAWSLMEMFRDCSRRLKGIAVGRIDDKLSGRHDWTLEGAGLV